MRRHCFKVRERELAWASNAILWWFEGLSLDLEGNSTGERSSLDALRQALKPYKEITGELPKRTPQEE